jgi:glycerol-3-phosphate dehydrogenase (NAD(P)+)
MAADRLSILGGGSWGTALAIALHQRFGEIRLWVHEPELAETMRRTRENPVYLPGFSLPGNIVPEAEMCADADWVLGVMPSQFARRVYGQLKASAPIVSATKGLEQGSYLRMSQVIRELHPDAPVAVLSGPTFAREVAKGDPAAVVVASEDASMAVQVQQVFGTKRLRLYTSGDVTGVEMGASMKNVIAIGAGVCAGLGLGSNAAAALITRGLAEMTRVAVAAGAQARTLAGLAGLGDLVLTANGSLSRNRSAGLKLAEGLSAAAIRSSTPMVAEGLETAFAVQALAARLGVEVPITEQLTQVIDGTKSAQEAMRDLLDRPSGPE